MQTELDYLRDEVSRLSSEISALQSDTDYGGTILYGTNEPAQSVSSGVFTNNLTLTFGSGIDANYAIEWCFTANAGSSTVKINARVQHNNTTTIWSVRTPPIGFTANDRLSFSGFWHLELLAGGHTFDLDFRNVGVGTVTLSQSRMRLVKLRDV